MEDVRYALRQLRHAFAAAAIVTLALGIGAASAMFGLIQGVLLSPPPCATRAASCSFAGAGRRTAARRGATIGQWLTWRSEADIEPPAM